MPQQPAEQAARTATVGPGSDPGSGRPALSRLVGDPVGFADRIWSREPRLLKATDGVGFTDLLDAAAVDELLSERGLRTPFLRVAKDGSTLANAAFTAPGGVGAGIADQVSDDRLNALFASGSSLVLQALHRTWPPIIAFCQQLAADLGHPVQANAYVTPPQNQGFDDHYDVHDVFVLQIAGRKHWSIHAPVLTAPLRDQPWTDRRAEVAEAARAEPLIDAVLEPGDVLYLPRGYLHAAKALGGHTIHLTLGIHSWTRYAVAQELTALALATLADDEEARASLGLGTGLAADDVDADLMTKKLLDALAAVDASAVAEGLRARRRTSQRAAPLGPLAQHLLSTSLGPDTVLRMREHLDPSVGADHRLTTRAGSVDAAEIAPDLLARLMAGEPVPAGDLGLPVAHRLVEAGIVVGG